MSTTRPLDSTARSAIRPGITAARVGSGADDGGFTLVEVVLAIAILSVAIAASAAGLSLAASVRSDTDARNLATEIANEVLQKAEAFGCGLPPDYNGVTAAERLAACDYDPADSTEGAALADTDFTIEREGHSFDVEVRMRWHATNQPPPASFIGGGGITCERRAWWANGVGRGNPALGGPERPTDPNLLSRTITVTPPSGSTVVLESTEAVDPAAVPHHAGYVFFANYVYEEVTLAQRIANVIQYEITLHADSQRCVWFPYLEYRSASNFAYLEDSTTYRPCDPYINSWDTTPPQNICHDYQTI